MKGLDIFVTSIFMKPAGLQKQIAWFVVCLFFLSSAFLFFLVWKQGLAKVVPQHRPDCTRTHHPLASASLVLGSKCVSL